MPAMYILSVRPPLFLNSARTLDIASSIILFAASVLAYSDGVRLYSISPSAAVPTTTCPLGVSYSADLSSSPMLPTSQQSA